MTKAPISYTATTVILNENCRLTKYAPLKIGSGSIKSIDLDLLGHVTAKKTPMSDFVKPKLKAFKRTLPNPYKTRDIELDNIALSFALNFAGSKDPIIIGETYILRETKTAKFHAYLPSHDAISLSAATTYKYSIDSTMSPTNFEELFKLTRKSLQNHPPLSLTLRRHSASLLRDDLNDKYIDLSIALESLISASSEISYKFSLLNTIIAEQDKNKRYDIFKLLRIFYSARSKIVHGSVVSSDYLKDSDFSRIKALAKLAIFYKIRFFAQGNSEEKWSRHMHCLALGQETPEW
ncbi:hypothetical protein BH10PSE9_BH10PSE9_00540 [soil metagenome]